MNRTTRDLALAGVVTGLAGLVTSQAAVWALQVENPPVVAVASAVRDLTPGPLALKLIHLVKHQDKPLLVTGTVVLLLALCAWLGTMNRRRPTVVDLGYLLLAGVGLLAVMRLDDSTPGSAIAVVVGLVTWLLVNRFLSAPILAAAEAETSGTETGSAAARASRRSFLRRTGGVGVGVLAAGALARFSSRHRREVEQARRLLRLPVTTGSEPTGADLGAGIEPWRTPNDEFYLIHTALVEPSIAPRDWELRVHGMVDRELTITYSDLVGRPITEGWVTLCCVSNEVGGDLIGNAWWSGVLVRDILAEAGVQEGADAVLQTSHDGWNCGTPLQALTDDRNAMLALAMNGKPLPIEHGFPVRTVVPGLYGYVSATKWLVDLEVTRFDQVDAYWTKRGWSERGPVKTQSRIDVPRDGSSVKTGRAKVGGSAWSQHTGIEKVEFQLDGGPWQEAELGTVPNVDTWVQWAGEVDVAEGHHTLVVRATDRSGKTQTSVRTDVVPDGATGWHTVEFGAG